MFQLFKMAFRDLGRNKRRTILSALAVSVGMGLLLMMSGVLVGEMQGALRNTIQLFSGHLQIRGLNYDENKISLKWEDLIENPQGLADTVKAQYPQIVDATPRLVASGIVTRGENSRGVQVIGFDPDATANQVYRQGLIEGEFLAADDREGILIGQPLAEKLNLAVGEQINLLVNTSNGNVVEQLFTIRGIYTTNTFGYDESTVFLPLAKAQTITGAEDRASLIFIILQDREQADAVAAALQSPNYTVVTWREMNALVVQVEDFANAYMTIFYLIVLGITATVVSNTLVMSVYERTREIGILAAIGMKGRRILAQFLVEAALLATLGVIGGVIFGGSLTYYFGIYGFPMDVSKMGITGVLMTNRIYTVLTVGNVIYLSVLTYIVTIVASFAPARMASQMEPVEALHGK
ncbi:MAG: ABC transporter permease [Chloroflexi bacterium]|nr:ABC transporter permease [Chloroflexota bacterium]